MVDYIVANKEWLFSGVGVSALWVIWGLFIRANKNDSDNKYENDDPDLASDQADEAVLVEEPSIETEAEKISKRFRRILDLMNEGRHYSRFTVSQMAKVMSLDRVGDLDKYFHGTDEPTFEFMRHFCEAFGVNERWLAEGKSHPFSNDDRGMADPLWYFNEIKEAKPEKIFFVRENTEIAQAFIVLQFSELKYKILQRAWHISGHVGAGGRSQLLSFYRLIKRLKKFDANFHFNDYSCRGVTLEKDEFDCLICGEVFPGRYLDCGQSEDPWWDDLTDVYHGYPIAEDYERMYGASFIKAQEIIRWELDKEKLV